MRRSVRYGEGRLNASLHSCLTVAACRYQIGNRAEVMPRPAVHAQVVGKVSTTRSSPTALNRPWPPRHPPPARDHRNRLLRPDCRASRASTLGPVRRQRCVDDLRRDHPQPAPRRRHPRQPGPCRGPRRHPAPRPDHRARPDHPPTAPPSAAPARALALGRAVDRALGRRVRHRPASHQPDADHRRTRPDQEPSTVEKLGRPAASTCPTPTP